MLNKFKINIETILSYLLIFYTFIAYANSCYAQPKLLIATVSNFTNTTKELAQYFTKYHHIDIEIISGSTGKLSAQIKALAPYDIFLGADLTHSKELITNNLAAPESLTIYAIGKLVLFTSNTTDIFKLESNDQSAKIEHILQNASYIAIANPNLSPYGMASKETLVNLKLWHSLQQKLVFGENINQSLQFTLSNAADTGFISLSQAIEHNLKPNQFIIIPKHLYQPIVQSGVILKSSKYTHEATTFMQFLQSKEAQEIITKHGYIFSLDNAT